MGTKLGMVVMLSVLLVGSAYGDYISYTDSYACMPLGTEVVPLSQFDSSLGTLNWVRVEVTTTQSASVTAENDSTIAGNMYVTLNGSAICNDYGLDVNATIVYASGAVPVEATDGVVGSGPDFHDFGLLQASDSGDQTLINGVDDVSSFIGTGTVDFSISSSGGWGAAGVSDASVQYSDYGAVGDVTVGYDYTPVPEPLTLSLVGLGGLAVLRRRA